MKKLLNLPQEVYVVGLGIALMIIIFILTI